MKQLLLDYFFKHVENKKDAIALCDTEGNSMTYGELADWSGKFWMYFQKKEIGTEDIVVIHMKRSIYLVSAILGVMRSGAAFTVAEAGFASSRLDYIVKDTRAKLVLDDSMMEDISSTELKEEYAAPRYKEVHDHDAAYIIYTSGSTGNPKGCVHEYGGLEYMLASTKVEHVTAGVFSLLIPMNMIAAMAGLFMMLARGVCVSIAPLKLLRNPLEMVDYMAASNITSTVVSPSLARLLSKVELNLDFVAMGSEPANGVFINNCILMNYYASSETGCLVAGFRVDRPYDKTPIGRPQFDLKYKLRYLDEKQKDGELMVYLPYARGYLNLPEQTAKVFEDHWYHTGDIVEELEGGDLLLKGRIDNMIKINGNRVEPEEVETLAMRVLKLPEAAAKGFEHDGRMRFYLFYSAEKKLDLKEATNTLMKYLPYYMLPTDYVRLDKLPRLSGGKVDRHLLTEPDSITEREAYTMPSNEIEVALCKAFSKVLDISDFSAAEDFYSMGGDSMGTVEAIEESHIPGLNAEDILNGRTPIKIAQIYHERTSKEREDAHILNSEAIKETYPLTENQLTYVNYRKLKSPSTGGDLKNIICLLERLDMNRLEEAVKRTVFCHPSLLTLYHKEDNGTYTQSYHPELWKDVKTEYITEEDFDKLKRDLVSPLDYFTDGLYRLRLFSTEKADYIYLQISNSCADGTSVRILFRDILRFYSNKDVKTDFYYLWLSKRALSASGSLYQTAKKYYEERYSTKKWHTLPQKDHPDQPGQSGCVSFHLEYQEELEVMKKRYHLGKNAVFSIALAFALAAADGERNIMTSWLFNGRNSVMETNIVGCLYALLPISFELEQNQSMKTLYEDIRDQMVKGVTYKCYPYLRIGYSPIKNDTALLIYQNDIYDTDPRDQIRTRLITLDESKAYGLNTGVFELEIIPLKDKIYCAINYNAAIYEEGTINKMKDLFVMAYDLMLSHAESDDFNTDDMIKELTSH